MLNDNEDLIVYHAYICVCDAKKDLFQWQELAEKLAQHLSWKGGRKKGLITNCYNQILSSKQNFINYKQKN